MDDFKFNKLEDKLDSRFDRLESKLDKFGIQANANKIDITWVKGHLKLSLTFLMAIVTSLVGWLFTKN